MISKFIWQRVLDCRASVIGVVEYLLQLGFNLTWCNLRVTKPLNRLHLVLAYIYIENVSLRVVLAIGHIRQAPSEDIKVSHTLPPVKEELHGRLIITLLQSRGTMTSLLCDFIYVTESVIFVCESLRICFAFSVDIWLN